MIDLSYHYKTKRTEFGRPYNILEETTPRILTQVDPDSDLRAKYEPISRFSLGSQAAVSLSQHSVNTEVTQTKLEDIVHKEGGWPQGIDPTNAPSCKQTRLKLEKKETFIPKLKELASLVDKTAKLNVALDLYSSDFPAADGNTEVSDPQVRTLSIFRDRYTQRYVSSISWSADSASVRRVALCYTPKDSAPNSHYESFIYNLECPSVPELELHPPSPLICLEYNAKDGNFLVGGMSHGSLSLWDVRQGSLPQWTSAIESSHRDAVHAARWISSKTAFECVSVSADGSSMTWDTRSTNNSPLEVVNLVPMPELLPEGFQPPFGGRCLDYHTGVPTKFMVGTVEGLVMTVNRKAADPNNRIAGVFPGHYGPVYAVRRHPTDMKYFCSVSDWCCRFFTEDNKTPLVTIPAQRHYLTNAVWGHARTTVVYTANIQGTVDAWDLIQSLRDPICSISVGHCPVYSMAAEPSGQFLLTGDADGTATLLELNDPLRTISQQERSLFNGMMGREAKRAKNYDQFLKEQKMRDKAKAVGGEDDGAKKETKPFDPSALESEFDAALRGEAEKVQEKKRVVIGGDEGGSQEGVSDSGAGGADDVVDDVIEDVLNPGEPAAARDAPPPEEEPKAAEPEPEPAAPEPAQEEAGGGEPPEPEPAAEPEPEPEPAGEGEGAEPANEGDAGAAAEPANEGGDAEPEPANEGDEGGAGNGAEPEEATVPDESESEPPKADETEPESEAAVEEVEPEAEQPPDDSAPPADSEVDVEEPGDEPPPSDGDAPLPDLIGGALG